MDLMTDSTFRIIAGDSDGNYATGIYRVILADVRSDLALVVNVEGGPKSKTRGGRKPLAQTKRKRKKSAAPSIGRLFWLSCKDLARMEQAGEMVSVTIMRSGSHLLEPKDVTTRAIYERRIQVMEGFLDIAHLKESVLIHRNLGNLIREAMTVDGASRSYIYKLWSMLCRHGFDVRSLHPSFDRCGAPGEPRRFEPGIRKKAGRKTLVQRIDRLQGVKSEPKQPGMSKAWRDAVLAADRLISTPKPKFSVRYTRITESHFVKRYQVVDGKFVQLDLEKGTYPNKRQVRHLLETEIPRIDRLLQETTKQHFKTSLRGLVGRSWRGISGPGHQSAIDSTIGDIFLRSSVNRAWIVGRPVVYLVIDVWSTAITGFYVCLTGPSWATASVSLFNSACSYERLADLWGLMRPGALNPAPCLSPSIMYDRGEGLSRGQRVTAFVLLPLSSFARPYMGPDKGIVEVGHRIAKDAQYLFVPGAIDYRRKEYELRRVDPSKCVFTVREYTQHLYDVFTEYNLKADRTNLVDAHMAAVGVMPSPAGLWRWGHQMGIGFRRERQEPDLITSLLPAEMATVGRRGVRFGGNDYVSPIVDAEQWSTHARNFGGWEIPIRYYPGAVSTIWTPNINGAGLIELQISDQAKASPELTYDEMLDAFAYQQLSRADIEHVRTRISVESYLRQKRRIETATALTAEAVERARGTQPTMTEARHIEVELAGAGLAAEMPTTTTQCDDALIEHEMLMKTIMRDLNAGENRHDE